MSRSSPLPIPQSTMLVSLSLLLAFLVCLVTSRPSSATSLTTFNPANVISDATLSNYTSMNQSDIQAAFNRYGQSCVGNLCIKNYSESGRSAAQIISESSATSHVNPQVLIALLETENLLITTASPAQDKLNSAFGFPCIDVQGVCSSSFIDQTTQATQFLSNLIQHPDQASYQTGQVVSLPYKPGVTACGTASFTVANTATAIIYSYPGLGFAPNQAAISAGMDAGDACSSYGVRNFYIALNQWFSSLNLYEYGPVYRFWSDKYRGHFYTIDQTERDRVIATWPDVWTYEGAKFCASNASTKETPDAVYRFWSDKYMHHFYTADPIERDRVIATWPDVWTYEGIAYYVKQ